MALVDVDRHILAEIVDLHKRTGRCIRCVNKAWHELEGLHAEMRGLIMHLINRIESVDTQNGKEKRG